TPTLFATIDYNTNPIIMAGNIQAGIATMFGLPNDGTSIVVSAGTTNANVQDFTIQFQGSLLGNANLGQISGNGATTSPTASTVQGTTLLDGAGDSVQTVTISGNPNQVTRFAFQGVNGQANVNEIQVFTNQ